MAPVIAFSTFLKFLQLPDGPRKTAMAKLLVPGGFSYWSPLQRIAPQAIQPLVSLDDLEKKIDQVCSGPRSVHNKNGLKALFKWGQAKPSTAIDPLPKLVVPFGNTGLSVQLRPELAFKRDGKSFSMAIWATTKPSLTDQVLSIGLFFMGRAYRAQGKTSHEFLIFDTVANRVFSEAEIMASTAVLLKTKHDAFKKDWAELNSTPPEAPGSQKEESPKPPSL